MRLLDSDEDMLEGSDPLPNPYLNCSHETRISLLAEGMQSERLCLINLLNAQHEFVELDEKITYPDTAVPKEKADGSLGMALLRYCKFTVFTSICPLAYEM
jgi:hypothetical protein